MHILAFYDALNRALTAHFDGRLAHIGVYQGRLTDIQTPAIYIEVARADLNAKVEAEHTVNLYCALSKATPNHAAQLHNLALQTALFVHNQHWGLGTASAPARDITIAPATLTVANSPFDCWVVSFRQTLALAPLPPADILPDPLILAAHMEGEHYADIAIPTARPQGATPA